MSWFQKIITCGQLTTVSIWIWCMHQTIKEVTLSVLTLPFVFIDATYVKANANKKVD